MMEDILGRLVDMFSSHSAQFDKDDGSSARALAAVQYGQYETLTSYFKEVGYRSNGSISIASATSLQETLLDACVTEIRGNPPSVNIDGDTITVYSNFPILEDRNVQSLGQLLNDVRPQTSAWQASQIVNLACAALVVEGRLWKLYEVLGSSSGGREKSAVDVAISTYVAARAQRNATKRVQSGVAGEIAETKARLDNYRAEFEATKNGVREHLDVLAAAAQNIRENQAAVSDAIKEDHETSRKTIHENVENFAEVMKQTREQLQNFEATTREEMKLESIRLSWESRFKEARWAFRIACTLLVIYLGVTIGSAYCFGLPIVKALATIEQTAAAVAPAPANQSATTSPPAAAPVPQVVAVPKEESVAVAIVHQFGRLIVFSVPVFVWLWAGRALMRYFMRSMLLMDDARQRQTMLDTYFLLSEKGRADERDRPLVLWALFRQTPGHGPDGIEPPDFTEVINAGLKRAGSPTS